MVLICGTLGGEMGVAGSVGGSCATTASMGAGIGDSVRSSWVAVDVVNRLERLQCLHLG